MQHFVFILDSLPDDKAPCYRLVRIVCIRLRSFTKKKKVFTNNFKRLLYQHGLHIGYYTPPHKHIL